jgi:MFS family permease
VTDPAKPSSPRSGLRWADLLAINSSTGALLGAITLVVMGSEIWGPFMPQYMKDLTTEGGGGNLAWVPESLRGMAQSLVAFGNNAKDWLGPILLIALYGSFRDLLEAINYLLGGWIAGRFNTRRGLLLFNAAPLVGLTILFLWRQPIAVFFAVPFVFIWDSIAGPALLTVVGDSLPSDRRAMAFSLQSLFRRMARILAYAINGGLVILAGTVVGKQFGGFLHDHGIFVGTSETDLAMTLAFGVSFTVVIASLLVQIFFMKTASKDASGTIIHRPFKVLRSFDPQLKRLLVADIGARLAEGMPRELTILFVIGVFMQAAGLAKEAAWEAFGVMLIISQVTSAITYIPMGFVASRPGLAKRPYIGVTFFFFASFPAVLALVGWLALRGAMPPWVVLGLAGVAFVFAGMREIGEPARKAMIVDLIPPEQKTQAIGIYWSSRCVAVMLAPLVGGLVWVGVNSAAGYDVADPAGPGPLAMLGASSLCGVLGVIYYYSRFGK